jgi:methionyl aminopeptidase
LAQSGREQQHVIELKTDTELALMREAGRVVARTLAAVRSHSQVGVCLKELDELAHGLISDAGARPSFLNYHPSFGPSPFPGVICTSVNDVIVHGIPDDYRLRDGDLVSIDCGAELDGWHGDSAITFTVGTPRAQDQVLMDATRRALDAGIAAATTEARLSDISYAIGIVGREAGYGIPADFGGHGIGRRMHEAPPVPNEARPGCGLRLRAGLVLAIEPMLMAGGADAYRTARDGWALHTADGSRAAHFEHTVAITEDGPRVLTMP